MRGFSVRRSDDLFNDPPPRRDWTWMTAGDAAKVLAVTRQRVHGLAETRQLAGERTMGGQWIFRWTDVRQLVLRRADEQARTREARLRVVRVRMLKAGPVLRQPRLRLVDAGEGERAVVDRQVKPTRSLKETA